jgi:hypothetical protein
MWHLDLCSMRLAVLRELLLLNSEVPVRLIKPLSTYAMLDLLKGKGN